MNNTTQTDIKGRLAGLRGGEYFDVWADFWKSEEADDARAAVRAQKDSGKFVVADLVEICDRFDLPFKTFTQQLEKDRVIPVGTYETLPAIGRLRKEVERRRQAETAAASGC